MRATLGILCTLLLGVLAGCGRGAGAASASPTPDAYQSAVRFSQCMRSHGVNIPDPQTISGGGGVGFAIKVTPGAGDQPINPDSAQFRAAQKACKNLLPNGGKLTPAQQAQAQQNALKFARCMRAHGVDVPDPQPGSGGLQFRTRTGGGGSGDTVGGPGVNPDDPKFQAAQKACGSLLGKIVGGGPVTNQSGG
jgi:hypothetical protein